MNLYAYAGNNPISFSDPFGLAECDKDKDPGCSAAQQLVDAASRWINNKVNQLISGATGLLDGLTPGGDMVRAGAGIDPATGARLSGGQRVVAAGSAGLKIAGMAGFAGAVVADGAAATTTGTVVFRVFGDDAKAMGGSWTTVNPGSVGNYRAAAGLPAGNSGRFVAEGVMTNGGGVLSRSSLPGAGGAGGLPELLVPNPSSQIRLMRVSGVNPPF